VIGISDSHDRQTVLCSPRKIFLLSLPLLSVGDFHSFPTFKKASRIKSQNRNLTEWGDKRIGLAKSPSLSLNRLQKWFANATMIVRFAVKPVDVSGRIPISGFKRLITLGYSLASRSLI